MPKIFLSGTLKPSTFLKRMSAHRDVSEGSGRRLIAERKILGFNTRFYSDGTRAVQRLDLTETEQFDSQVLRFAHASIIINEPVGDKNACWVDATKNPVEIILFNKPIKSFLKDTKQLVSSGKCDPDFVLDSPLGKISELSHE